MTSIKNNYKHTIISCFICNGIQAVLINFAPLLFLTFQDTYDLTFSQLTILITINFITQLLVDLAAVKYVDRIGHKNAILFAHGTIAIGLAGLAIFPSVFPTPYIGLLVAVMLYAIGGGLIEVLVSPIVESCPTENKSATMSLLHSFYCWGHVFVVLASTLFFVVVGIQHWRILAIIWACLPIANGIYFHFVPLVKVGGEEHTLSIKKLGKNKLFWVLLLIMICAGACEQAMSQWASTFAETGLGVSKTMGDLAGPCLFAICMGLARVFYAKMSHKINLSNFMIGSGVLCILSYFVVAFSPFPIFAFIASAFCGLSVGIMWPGTISIGAEKIPSGGTAMFAFFALAGDIGCTTGPTVVGMVFEQVSKLQIGFAVAMIFPLLLLLGVWFCKKQPSA